MRQQAAYLFLLCVLTALLCAVFIPRATADADDTVPAVTTGGASSITGHSAVLSGTVNPGSTLTMYYFEYGTDTGYGNTTQLRSAGMGAQAVAVNETVSGLMEGTTCHFRVKAFNINGSADGQDAVFSTCRIKMSGLTVSGTRTVNMPLTFTLDARSSCASPLYYRFSMHPDYGTDEYDGRHWQQMTATEWVSTGSIDYTFTSAGKYVVVVWVTDDTGNVNPAGIPIIGFSVDIAGSPDQVADNAVFFSGCTVSGVQETGSPVTLSIDAADASGGPVFYRFSMHPDYGTGGYDGRHWQQMTATEWVSTGTIDTTFATAGKYIVVVWMTLDTVNVDPTGIPIAGFSINVSETGEDPLFD